MGLRRPEASVVAFHPGLAPEMAPAKSSSHHRLAVKNNNDRLRTGCQYVLSVLALTVSNASSQVISFFESPYYKDVAGKHLAFVSRRVASLRPLEVVFVDKDQEEAYNTDAILMQSTRYSAVSDIPS